MGDVFSLVAVAPGGRLHNHAVLVGRLDGEPVQLQHQHDRLVADEIAQLVHLLGLVQRQQGDVVGHLGQPLFGGPAHCLGGRIAHLGAQLLFQLGQLVKQSVILCIVHRSGVEVVILPAVLVQQIGQRPQAVHFFLVHIVPSL